MSQPVEETEMNEQTARDRLIEACDTDRDLAPVVLRERLIAASRTSLADALAQLHVD